MGTREHGGAQADTMAPCHRGDTRGTLGGHHGDTVAPCHHGDITAPKGHHGDTTLPWGHCDTMGTRGTQGDTGGTPWHNGNTGEALWGHQGTKGTLGGAPGGHYDPTSPWGHWGGTTARGTVSPRPWDAQVPPPKGSLGALRWDPQGPSTTWEPQSRGIYGALCAPMGSAGSQHRRGSIGLAGDPSRPMLPPRHRAGSHRISPGSHCAPMGSTGPQGHHGSMGLTWDPWSPTVSPLLPRDLQGSQRIPGGQQHSRGIQWIPAPHRDL